MWTPASWTRHQKGTLASRWHKSQGSRMEGREEERQTDGRQRGAVTGPWCGRGDGHWCVQMAYWWQCVWTAYLNVSSLLFSENCIRRQLCLVCLEEIFFFLIFKFFLSALGLCCHAWAFSSCSELGLLFVEVSRLIIVVASLIAEHGL